MATRSRPMGASSWTISGETAFMNEAPWEWAPEFCANQAPCATAKTSIAAVVVFIVPPSSVVPSCPRFAVRHLTALTAPLRNPDQFLELRRAERSIEKLELDRILHALVRADHAIDLQALFGNELGEHALDRALGQLGKRDVARDRVGARIHPIERLAVGGEIARNRILLLLQGVEVGDLHPDGLAADARDVARAGDEPDLALGERIEVERCDRPADVDLSRHGLCGRRGDVAGRNGPCL